MRCVSGMILHTSMGWSVLSEVHNSIQHVHPLETELDVILLSQSNLRLHYGDRKRNAVQGNKESRETHLHAARQNRKVYVTECGTHSYH
jgi:hypothetical protein